MQPCATDAHLRHLASPPTFETAPNRIGTHLFSPAGPVVSSRQRFTCEADSTSDRAREGAAVTACWGEWSDSTRLGRSSPFNGALAL